MDVVHVYKYTQCMHAHAYTYRPIYVAVTSNAGFNVLIIMKLMFKHVHWGHKFRLMPENAPQMHIHRICAYTESV